MPQTPELFAPKISQDPNRFDLLNFILRAAPYHRGHQSVIEQGLTKADRLVLHLGSAYQAPNLRNPFSADEREHFIGLCHPQAVRDQRLVFTKTMDRHKDARWLADIHTGIKPWVEQAHAAARPGCLPKIGVIGYAKDASSFYLNLFPTWGSVRVAEFLGPQDQRLDATNIRYHLFASPTGIKGGKHWLGSLEAKSVLADPVRDWLRAWLDGPSAAHVAEEARKVAQDRTEYGIGPFMAVDAVVVQAGNILLVRRRGFPGKGLWALPGGFVRPGERLRDAMLRELTSETRIKVPERVLNGSVQKMQVFDNPYRSVRGHVITSAFLIELSPDPYQRGLPSVRGRRKENQEPSLPAVQGNDDADRAVWVPLSSIRPETLYEDHAEIIATMINIPTL